MAADISEVGNLIEAFLWLAVGAVFLFALIRPDHRRAKILAAVNFAAFGISDLVEMHTGAWWRPWWLLAWKAACVAVMVLQLLHYSRRKRQQESREQG